MEWITRGMVRSLSRLANIASRNQFHDEALKMHTAVSLARPDSFIPHLGIGVIHINSGNFDDAITSLRDHAMKLGPDEPTVKTFLGLALKMNGQKDEADALLNDVISNSEDEDSKTLAENILKQEDI